MPSRLDVVIHSAPSASSTTVRSRPYWPPRNSSGSAGSSRAGAVERERVHPLAVQGAEEHHRRPPRRSRRARPPRRGSRRPARCPGGRRSHGPPVISRFSSSGPGVAVVGGVDRERRPCGQSAVTSRCPRLNTGVRARSGGRRRRSAAPCRPATPGRRPARGCRCRRCRRSRWPSAPKTRPPPLCVAPRGMPVKTGFGRAAQREADDAVVGRGGDVGVEAARPRGTWARGPARAGRRRRLVSMPGTVISSRGGERSGKTWSSRPVSRSPTIGAAVGQHDQAGGHARGRWRRRSGRRRPRPSPGSAGSPGTRRLGRRRPDLGGAPSGSGRNGPTARSRRRRSRSAATAASRTASEPRTPALPPAPAHPDHSTCASGRPPTVGARAHADPRSRRAPARAGARPGARRRGRGALPAACARTGSTRPTAPPTGEAAQAQVWVPRAGGAGVPDDGFLDALPRLRLVQLLSAGAERFAGRLPEGVAALQRPWRAHPGDRGVGDGRDPRRPARHPVLRPRAGGRALVVQHASARWSVRGSSWSARATSAATIGRMLDGFDVELDLRGPHRPGRRPVDRRAARAAAARRRRDRSSSP